MSNLNITIVEEQTKRLGRNLALTETRRRVITFQEPRTPFQMKVNSKMCSTRTADSANSSMTVTTVAIPYKHFKIWTDHDKDMNFRLHIKECKKPNDSENMSSKIS